MSQRDLQTFLTLVEEQPKHKEMMQALPANAFVSLQMWPTLQSKLRGFLIAWLHTRPIKALPMLTKADQTFQLTFGKIHHLYSGTLALGYIIELPKMRLDITRTYVVAAPTKLQKPLTNLEDLPKMDHILNNNHLSVFMMGSGQIITCNNRNLVDYLT
jgi:hypothetical protein